MTNRKIKYQNKTMGWMEINNCKMQLVHWHKRRNARKIISKPFLNQIHITSSGFCWEQSENNNLRITWFLKYWSYIFLYTIPSMLRAGVIFARGICIFKVAHAETLCVLPPYLHNVMTTVYLSTRVLYLIKTLFTFPYLQIFLNILR